MTSERTPDRASRPPNQPRPPRRLPGARALVGGRRVLRIGLAALWLLDGLLQLQPGMFAMDMIGPTMQPTATPEPAWLSALLTWSIHHATAHLTVVNATVAALELLVGGLLVSGRRRAVRSGAFLSIGLALVLWLFGESLGQLLSGTASLLDGAPGAMLLYAVAAAVLLAPASWWSDRNPGGPATPTAVAATVLGLGTLLQLQRVFWTPLGLAQPFGDGAMMPQPHWLRAATGSGATLALNAAPAFNAGLVVAWAALGGALVLWPRSRPVLWIATALLTAVWIVGQDAGMLFSGMATDPNSMPALVLLLWAGHAAGRCGVDAGGPVPAPR